MSSTLYRKYRPAKFSEIIGQKHIVRTLSNAITNNRIGQAYLLTGPRGTGKTTLARVFAKTVNCTSLKKTPKEISSSDPCLECENCKQFQNDKFTDIVEIDAASNTGVDNIRDLRETARLSPLQGKFKIYIIDEVHMLSQGAFNALLKILEEPPSHIIFILATTEIHKVPETIISRCQRFDFSKFTSEEIIDKLSKKIAKAEKIKIDRESLELIALMAEGSMRDAESLLDQIITLEKNNITTEKIEALLGISGTQSIEKITGLILDKNISGALLFVNQIYKDGYNLEVFAKSWLDYLRKIMLLKASPDLKKQISVNITKNQEKNIENFAQKTTNNDILLIVESLSDTITKIKLSFIPQLPLEYMIISLCNNSMKETNKSNIDSKNKTRKTQQVSTPERKQSNKYTTSKKIKTEEIKKGDSKNKSIKLDNKNNSAEIMSIDIYKVKKAWKETVAKIKERNYSLSMMLSNSKPIENTSQGIVQIVVKHSFHKDILNKPENKLTIKNISNKITGLVFKVEAVTEAESGIKLKTVTPVAKQKDQSSENDSDNNSQGSLLADAMNLMGGKVVES